MRDVLAYYHDPWHHHHYCSHIVDRYAEEIKKPNNGVKSTIGRFRGIVLGI